MTRRATLTNEDIFEDSCSADEGVIARFTREHRSRIYEVWKAVIRDRADHHAGHMLDILQTEYESGADLLSKLAIMLVGGTITEPFILHELIKKIHTREYSVLDLYCEIFSLQDALEITCGEQASTGHSLSADALKMTRRFLDRIFTSVLKETSLVYENAIESGKRGFCQMDTNGSITYCNAEIERIFKGQNILGERLDRLFPETQQEYVRNAILCSGNAVSSREIEITDHAGGKTTVWAEIEPVTHEDKNAGFYAMLTDISPVAKRETAVFDASPWCVVKVDSLGYITYANEEAMSLFNIKNYQGRRITEFVEGKNREIIVNALKSRLSKENHAYRIHITPGGTTKPVEIEICGISVTDSAGTPVGSIGIFHNREIDNASQAILSQVAEKHHHKEMLEAVAKIVNELIPFDCCVVTRFSQKNDDHLVHFNPFFTYIPGDGICWQQEWTPMTEAMVRWLHRDKIETYVLEEFLQLDEWKVLADDPNVKQSQKMGYKSFMFKVAGAGEGKKLLAAFTLISRSDRAFDKRARDILEKLPLDQVMMMALHQHKISEMRFRSGLVKKIAQATSLKSAASIFVEKLQSHYKWLHVSLFRVDRYQKKLVLQAQKADNPSMCLPEDFSQQIGDGKGVGEGLLSSSYNSQKIVNEGDVLQHSDFKAGIIGEDGSTPTRSELCYPIKVCDEIGWILNVEHTQINAFSFHEEREVAHACDEFSALIERLSHHFTFQACFDSTTDPVIITDNANNIVRINPSAKKLLGGDDDVEVTGNLVAFFADQYEAGKLLEQSGTTSTEVTLLQKSKGKSRGINMLMSCCELPREFGEKVYISKDLSSLRRMEELMYLSQLSYEVAAQCQAPLSLAFTWLRGLRDGDSCPGVPDICDKIMHQLRKVQSVYDRMAFYDGNASSVTDMPIDLNLVVEMQRMLDRFPETDREMVVLPPDEDVPYIRADPVCVSFILESIFSYLLRYASRERVITAVMREKRDMLQVKIIGIEPLRDLRKDPYHSFLERMRIDIAIGRKMLESFIESQGGELLATKRKNGQVIFEMQFPIS